MSKTKTKKTAKKTVRTSTSSGVSTLRSMNDRLASMTAAAKPAPQSKPSKRVEKSDREPSLVFAPPSEEQVHDREACEAVIRALREKVGKMYAEGKFSSSTAFMVPLTHLDNATYYKCAGWYDRAVSICNNYESTL
jgi:hypothetical protein